RRRHVRIVRLEVRSSNVSAQKLYSSLGYAVTQRLPKYYSNGGDGLLMVKSLLGSNSSAIPSVPAWQRLSGYRKLQLGLPPLLQSRVHLFAAALKSGRRWESHWANPACSIAGRMGVSLNRNRKIAGSPRGYRAIQCLHPFAPPENPRRRRPRQRP